MSSRRRARQGLADVPLLDAAEVDQLDARGWLALPGVLTGPAAQQLGRRCAEALADKGDDLRVGDKSASGTRRLVELRDRVPEVADVLADPRLTAAVATVVGDGASYGDATFRSPQPGYGEQRFHADDVPRLDDGPFRVVTAIVALCDFTVDNGATAVVPGSHRRPDLQRSSGSLEAHDDELVLTGPAGTAFVFNGHLLHRGTRNRSSAPRPAIQATWRRP